MRAYSYLLGLYLGDGCLTRYKSDVYGLRIVLDRRHPMIIVLCEEAMAEVSGRRVSFSERPGCVEVRAYWRRWPELFPQHGSGPKHERPIRLEQWQQAIVESEPECLLRGLIHSDGSRWENIIRHPSKTYVYPRYGFCNASADIRQIFTDACDRVGVEWRQMNARNVSVAKRDSVEKLDHFGAVKR